MLPLSVHISFRPPIQPTHECERQLKGTTSLKVHTFITGKDLRLYASTEDPQNIVITFHENTSKLHLRGTVLNRIDSLITHSDLTSL